MTTDRRATRAAAEIDRINNFFPLMSVLGNRWAATRPFEGRVVGISAHLTTLTGALVQELALGGGEWILAGASGATTDAGVVELLRSAGIHVYTTGSREDAHLQVLDHHPDLLADVGADLIGTLLRRRPAQAAEVKGAVEVTRSGVVRLEELSLPFGVVNINDGRLKNGVENRHGVGEGLWHSVQSLTGMHLSGRRVGVIGYGPVGRGVAAYARAAGAAVQVVELDPVRRLLAHYDGFPTPTLHECLPTVKIAVTCTGVAGALSAALLPGCRDGLVLLNAGHGADEIDVRGLQAMATAVDHVADLVTSYTVEGGGKVVLLAEGNPLNIVTNAGSPEPVLLHFAVLGLTLEWLTGHALSPGLSVVPGRIEDEAADLALRALGMAAG
jgi:adenosylhomocysteinase